MVGRRWEVYRLNTMRVFLPSIVYSSLRCNELRWSCGTIGMHSWLCIALLERIQRNCSGDFSAVALQHH